MDFVQDCSTKKLIYFLVPLILAELFQQIYSLINTIIVCRVLNYHAVAVIGACSGIISIRGTLISGLIGGFGIYLGKSVGSGNKTFLKEVVSCIAWYCLGIGALGIAVLPLRPVIILMGGIPQELYGEANLYLGIAFAGSICIVVKMFLLVILQALGDTRFFSFLAVIGVVMNTGMVLVFVGLLHGGVYCSILAIILTNLIQAICLFFYVQVKHREMLTMLSPSKISKKIWGEVLKNGITKTIYFLLGAVGNACLQKSINQFSIEVIAGQSWGRCLQNILFAPLGELGTAAGVITGQNAGAKNKRNIIRYHRKLRAMLFGFGIMAIAIIYLGGTILLQYLIGQAQPLQVKEEAFLWIRITVLVMPFCMSILYRNELQALGHYVQVILLGLIEMAGIIFTTQKMIPIYGYSMGAMGTATTWVIQAMAGMLFFYSAVKGEKGER